MVINEKMLGRAVEARLPMTDTNEVMVLQGMTTLSTSSESYPYAICEDSKGILRVISVDDMRFVEPDISVQTNIRRYSLIPIQEEDMTLDNLVGQDDIYDNTREHKVTIVNVVIRIWENPDKDYRTEAWREAIDTEGNCYSAGMLYWKGPKA